MINSVAVATQAVAANQNVLFPTDRVRTKSCNTCCGWLSHDVGSGLFTLTKPGIYEVEYNADITSTDTGQASLVLEQNGEAIGGTEMDYTPAAANVYESVSASTLVKVPPCSSVAISVKNISESSVLVKDSNIIVKKIA